MKLDIIDQPAAAPLDGNWDSKNWKQWGQMPDVAAMGYVSTMYLGLAHSNRAVKNADNYAMFALCSKIEELNCLSKFQDEIKAKRSLSFAVDPKVARQIQAGKVDLTNM